MKERFMVALAQISCKPGDKEQNLKKIEGAVARAEEKGAALLILPELSLTGYVVRDQIYELAEEIPGPSTRIIERIARDAGIHVVFGMPEKSKKTQATLHNTAVLVGPKGFIGKYRKMYLQLTASLRKKDISAQATKPRSSTPTLERLVCSYATTSTSQK